MEPISTSFADEATDKIAVVNEEGVEAAAVTVMEGGFVAGQSNPLVFQADHPFVFLIRDNRSGNIFFLGHLINPQS